MKRRPNKHPLVLATFACCLSSVASADEAANASIEERIVRLEQTIAELKSELPIRHGAPPATPAVMSTVIQTTPILSAGLSHSRFSIGGFSKLDGMLTRTELGTIATETKR